MDKSSTSTSTEPKSTNLKTTTNSKQSGTTESDPSQKQYKKIKSLKINGTNGDQVNTSGRTLSARGPVRARSGRKRKKRVKSTDQVFESNSAKNESTRKKNRSDGDDLFKTKKKRRRKRKQRRKKDSDGSDTVNSSDHSTTRSISHNDDAAYIDSSVSSKDDTESTGSVGRDGQDQDISISIPIHRSRKKDYSISSSEDSEEMTYGRKKSSNRSDGAVSKSKTRRNGSSNTNKKKRGNSGKLANIDTTRTTRKKKKSSTRNKISNDGNSTRKRVRSPRYKENSSKISQSSTDDIISSKGNSSDGSTQKNLSSSISDEIDNSIGNENSIIFPKRRRKNVRSRTQRGNNAPGRLVMKLDIEKTSNFNTVPRSLSARRFNSFRFNPSAIASPSRQKAEMKVLQQIMEEAGETDEIHISANVPDFLTDEQIIEMTQFNILTYIDESHGHMIYAGTFEMIVETLLDWLITIPNRKAVFCLLYQFLYCYLVYATPLELLELVISYWSREPPLSEDPEEYQTKTRSSVIFFLSGWFERKFEDFKGETFDVLNSWIRNDIDHSYSSLLKGKIEQVRKTPPPNQYLIHPMSAREAKYRTGKFGFKDLKASQIAEQWSLLDMQNFMDISTQSFITDDDAWNLMLKRSAMFTRWVASEIVDNIQMKNRVIAMKKFIQVALKFIENNNFNGLMCVWGGLNMVSVSRLSKTKKKLPKSILNTWETLEEKLSESNNFGNLRRAMEKKLKGNIPFIPWFELIVKLRNWVQNYADVIENVDSTQPFLNFSKISILGNQIIDFVNYKKNNMCIYTDLDERYPSGKTIRTWMEHLPTYSDDMLWQLSHQCETD
eukprot:TRINITY_DN8238_c0_g1_i1.p1 TRINITY_DN8238_c0_g1~~TRINITY_DN8238_c0_g1_i1.p1  ORF type:complete len:835 (-),score=187.36 TRINITY_DN8238_c0_g1_i1:56-2560(-)